MHSTDLPELSHQQAVQEVYKHTPQIIDYDEFMHIGARWLPYTMYFHPQNFRSNTVNTDAMGFRYTVWRQQRYSVNELHGVTKVNLLVGGSTALGVGATSDAATVASQLSEITGELWLTLAGRGYNSRQELLLFLLHRQRLPEIGKVLVLSGMNTLALEGIPDEYATEHGRYYYSYEFQHYMNMYNADMARQKNSFRKKNHSGSTLDKIKAWLADFNPADMILTDQDCPLAERIKRAAFEITHNLQQWQLLLAPDAAKLYFALQPLSYWCKKQLTAEESAVFHAIDSCPNNFYRLFQGVLGPEVHLPFFQSIQSQANDIPCFDINQILPGSALFSQTLFVDRVHFNDQGNAELARLLQQHILGQCYETA